MAANLLPAVAVLGLGAMGHGIAQTFAAAGHLVRCYDEDPAARATVHERVRANLQTFVDAELLRIIQRRQRRDALFLALSKLLYPGSVGGAA